MGKRRTDEFDGCLVVFLVTVLHLIKYCVLFGAILWAIPLVLGWIGLV